MLFYYINRANAILAMCHAIENIPWLFYYESAIFSGEFIIWSCG